MQCESIFCDNGKYPTVNLEVELILVAEVFLKVSV